MRASSSIRQDFEAPQVVVRFGAVPTSKYLNDYLERAAPPFQVHVRSSGVWADDSHRVRYYLQVDETAFCRRMGGAVSAGRLANGVRQSWPPTSAAGTVKQHFCKRPGSTPPL